MIKCKMLGMHIKPSGESLQAVSTKKSNFISKTGKSHELMFTDSKSHFKITACKVEGLLES
jgi:hypothetical protein